MYFYVSMVAYLLLSSSPNSAPDLAFLIALRLPGFRGFLHR